MNETDWQRDADAATKVVLVTGAGRRVGEVVARQLAARGYRLILHANTSIAAARTTATELAAQGADAVALQADIRDESQVRDLVEWARDRFGQIDVLVNSAAVWNAGPLEDVTAGDLKSHWEVNTLGTFLCCQQAGLVMVAQPTGGVLVNIGDWAIVRPYTGYSAYFPSKGAIPTLTRSLAVELARRNPNVRVNAILPGPVLLPEGLTDEEKQAVIRSTLVQRAGRPENVAHAVAFLIENDFVTGVCLPVDGGRSVACPPCDSDPSSDRGG